MHYLYIFLTIIIFIFSGCKNDDNKDKKLANSNDAKYEKFASSDDILIAKTFSIPVGTVVKSMIFRESFTDFHRDIRENYNADISASYLEDMPAMRGHIRFVGSIPQELFSYDGFNISEKTVALAEGGKAVLEENGLISREEHFKRTDIAAEAIFNYYQGYFNDMGVGYNPIIDKIKVDMHLEEWQEEPSLSEVVRVVREEFTSHNLSENAKYLRDDGILLEFRYGEETKITFD